MLLVTLLELLERLELLELQILWMLWILLMQAARTLDRLVLQQQALEWQEFVQLWRQLVLEHRPERSSHGASGEAMQE